MVEPADIVDLAREYSFAHLTCGDDQDLLRAAGMEGEAANAFFDAFALKYAVNMNDFLWFFHYAADEPPYWRRVKPVGRDGRAFPMLPITPRLLADAANEKRWPLEYPSHRLRVSRWPMIVMFVLLASLVLAVTVIGATATM